MKIAFVTSGLGAGGAEKILTLLADHFAGRGHEVRILSIAPERAPFFPPSSSVALEWVAREESRGIARAWSAFRGIRRSIRRHGFDRVVSFIDQTNILTLLAAAGTGVPVVVSERTFPEAHTIVRLTAHPLLRRAASGLRRAVYPLASKVIVQTEEARRWFGPSWEGRVVVVPNPVFPPPAGTSRTPGAEPVIVSIGRLVPGKRFDLLVRAFEPLSRRHPDWRLEIFGEGPERGVLEGLVRSLGLERKVRLGGVTKDPHAALASAEIFALASDNEGFPGALCEAMASGCAVVSTDCPAGPGEIVRDGIDGILVPVGDQAALSRALESLVGDPARRRSLGAEARRIVERFAAEGVLARWEALVLAGSTRESSRK